MGQRGLAAAEVQTNLMDAVGVNENEIIIERFMWENALFASHVTKLYTQSKIFQ
jgi:hypothetical protein